MRNALPNWHAEAKLVLCFHPLDLEYYVKCTARLDPDMTSMDISYLF